MEPRQNPVNRSDGLVFWFWVCYVCLMIIAYR